MKTKLFFALLALSVLLSCQDRKQTFTQETMTFEAFPVDSTIPFWDGYWMVAHDPHVLIANVRTDSLICCVNTMAKSYQNRGKIGQGPNEFLYFANYYKINGQLGFYDDRLRVCTDIVFDSDDRIRFIRRTKFSTLNYHLLPTIWGTHIAIGPYEKGRFRLMDSNGQQIKMLGEQPFRDEDERDIPELARAMAYQGDIAVSSSGNRLVDAIYSSPIINFYELSKDTIRLLKSHIECWPTYKPELGENSYAAAMSRYNKHGYVGVVGTERYVYGLYSGQSFAEHAMSSLCGHSIRVFDWDGNFLKEYLFDIDLRTFCVSDDDTTVYAIGLLDDFELVVGKMNHVGL